MNDEGKMRTDWRDEAAFLVFLTLFALFVMRYG